MLKILDEREKCSYTNSKIVRDKNISFMISSKLAKKIEKAIEDWGGSTKSEFFRFCAIEFLRSDATAMCADQTLS